MNEFTIESRENDPTLVFVKWSVGVMDRLQMCLKLQDPDVQLSELKDIQSIFFNKKNESRFSDVSFLPSEVSEDVKEYFEDFEGAIDYSSIKDRFSNVYKFQIDRYQDGGQADQS